MGKTVTKSQPTKTANQIYQALKQRIDQMSVSHQAMVLLMCPEIEETKVRRWVLAAARLEAQTT